MRNIDEFNYLRRPMMVAISRKGYLGLLLGLKKEDRLPMTLVTEAAMMLKGGGSSGSTMLLKPSN
ncbi:hypothetical protein [Lactiplantibacillus plantarum]